MSFDFEDAQSLLSEVESFCAGRVVPAASRPQMPMSGDLLATLSQEARTLGILPAAGPEAGFALWEDVTHSAALMLHLGILAAVARADAGLALAWHRAALARVVARELGWRSAAPGPLAETLVTVGHWGTGGGALARRLDGAAPSPSDDTDLADWLDRRTHATTVIAPRDWCALTWPVWREGTIVWERAARVDLIVEAMRPQHGFDELAAYRVRSAADGPAERGPADAASLRLHRDLVKMDMLGLTAIGSGAIAHAERLAGDYAAMRRQGGRVIAEHDAVRRLTAEIATARHVAEILLTAFVAPLDDIDLGRVAAARIALSDRFRDAANAAVQIFGGIGYMRDTGAEKILRDVNALRLQSGGTRDLAQFLAGRQGGPA